MRDLHAKEGDEAVGGLLGLFLGLSEADPPLGVVEELEAGRGEEEGLGHEDEEVRALGVLARGAVDEVGGGQAEVLLVDLEASLDGLWVAEVLGILQKVVKGVVVGEVEVGEAGCGERPVEGHVEALEERVGQLGAAVVGPVEDAGLVGGEELAVGGQVPATERQPQEADIHDRGAAGGDHPPGRWHAHQTTSFDFLPPEIVAFPGSGITNGIQLITDFVVESVKENAHWSYLWLPTDTKLLRFGFQYVADHCVTTQLIKTLLIKRFGLI